MKNLRLFFMLFIPLISVGQNYSFANSQQMKSDHYIESFSKDLIKNDNNDRTATTRGLDNDGIKNLTKGADLICGNQSLLTAQIQKTDISCYGLSDGSASVNIINAVPPISYLWNTGATTMSINNLNVGTYSVTIIDGIGDSLTLLTTIQQPNQLLVNLMGDDTICEGNGTLLATGVFGGTTPYTYFWSNGAGNSMSQIAYPDSTQTITVVVTDSNLCSVSDSLKIMVYPVVKPFIGADTIVCDSLLLDAGIGYSSYLWTGGGTLSSLKVDSSGTYIVTVTDINNCSTSDTANIQVVISPSIDLGPDSVVCGGDSIVLQAGLWTNTSFTWNDGSTGSQLTVDTSGIYWVIAANICGVSADTIAIVIAPSPSVDLGPDAIKCHDTLSHTFHAGPGLDTYLWSNGSTDSTYKITTPGTIWVTVSNACGSASDTVSYIEFTTPVADLGSDRVMCFLDTLVFVFDTIYQYLTWWDYTHGPSNMITSSGTYWVMSENICDTIVDSVNITFDGPYNVNIGNDTSITILETLMLQPTSTYHGYYWNTGDTTHAICVDGSVYGVGTFLFWLQVTNQYNCKARDSIIIRIDEVSVNDLIGNPHLIRLYPNPVSDNLIVTLPENSSYCEIEICNPEGKLMIKKIYSNQQEMDVDMVHLKPGFYFLRIKTERSMTTYRVLKI